MTFTLHPDLTTKVFVTELPLCRVLLEDNAHYPWLFLVPRRPNISRMSELTPEDQLQLMHELTQAQQILSTLFAPTQINVAAIGNKTPQLHVHVIARTQTDPAWPKVVWGHPASAPYDALERSALIAQLQEAFGAQASSLSAEVRSTSVLP